MKNKKAKMNLAIVLLVFATLALCAVSLIIFYLRDDDLSQRIHSPEILDQAYIKAEQIDFYLSQIINVVGEDATASEFNTELDKYKDEYGSYPLKELSQAKDKNFEFKIVGGNEIYSYVYIHKFEYKV